MDDHQKLFETTVIVYNVIQHISKSKLPENQPYRIDQGKTLAKKLDRLIFTLEKLTERLQFDDYEDISKRLSLCIINLNKIVVVLYVYIRNAGRYWNDISLSL